MDTTLLLWMLAVFLVLSGIAGLMLPALPGAPLLFAGLFVAAWVEDFIYVGTGTLIVLAVLAVLIGIVDFIAGALGAKHFGASPRAVTGAVIGAALGLFFGLPGVLLGPFAGAVIGEWSVHKDLHAATRAGFGASLGLLIAAVAKVALAFTMIGVFVVMRLV